MRFQVVRAVVLTAALAGGLATAARAQDQSNPPQKAEDKPSSVLVNGMLAVPDAPKTETTPSKYSEENAKSDRMQLLDFTFKTLSDEQRAAIYRSIKSSNADKRPLDASYASVGLEIPATAELEALPQDATQAAPRTKDYRYAMAGDKVLLVWPANRFVVGVIGP
jgi:hypothetical protein